MKIDSSNMLVINGMVYALVTKEDINENEPENFVCKLCNLRYICDNFSGQLCDIHDALTNQFYVMFDGIEVVSEQIVNGIVDSNNNANKTEE